jgi:hypothetical protein
MPESETPLFLTALKVIRANQRFRVLVISTLCFGSLMSIERIPRSILILTAISWFLGLCFGGKYRLFRSFLRYRNLRVMDRTESWRGAFSASLAGAMLTGGLLVSGYQLTGLLAAMGISYGLCYGGNKLCCWSIGCCGWPLRLETRLWAMLIPLQLLECSLSFCTSIVAGLMFFRDGGPTCAFGFSCVSHAGLRFLSLGIREQPRNMTSLVFRSDTGLICLAGASIFLASLQ